MTSPDSGSTNLQLHQETYTSSQFLLCCPVFDYQPFSMTDLLNWKQHTPSYSEKPQAVIGLLESIFQTHCPTWGDCLQRLLTLFNTEEWG